MYLLYVYIQYPIGSMYGIYTYIWLILMVNVGKYTIHGSYGYMYLQDVLAIINIIQNYFCNKKWSRSLRGMFFFIRKNTTATRFLEYTSPTVSILISKKLTQNYTLPETNSSHLKMDRWKTILSLLGWPIFRGEPLVSGRVVILRCA